MKIEILTIHRLNNFGSAFQAMALFECIRDMGHDVELLDYHPSYYKGNKIRNHIGRIIFRKKMRKRELKFDRFIETNAKLSAIRFVSLKELQKQHPNVDLYIAGGDQLWNYNHICGNDDAYKLTFWNGRKMSYGTSLGGKEFDPIQIKDLKLKLKEFQSLSLREASSVSLLHDYGINATWVVDPVLLLPFRRYEELLIQPMEQEKYVFVYLVAPSKLLDYAVEYLSGTKGLKVIVYSGFGHKCKCDLQIRDLGPEEVLGYIRNAEFVLSSSFHATLFAIMFQKKFGVILPGEETNERIYDLLSWTNLTKGIIKKEKDIKELVDTTHFYISELDGIMEERIRRSKEYLINSIYEEG